MGIGDSSFLQSFGIRLRETRVAAGISQEHLAALADLDRTYISILERGLRNPSLLCVGKLAAALGVQISELCDLPLGSPQ
jgi:transcriptional regulator with XRE-family HTH domain